MVVESSVEVVMYVEGIEKAAMEDFINTKDTLEKIIMLPTVSLCPSLICPLHFLRLTSSTSTTFIMSMFMFSFRSFISAASITIKTM